MKRSKFSDQQIAFLLCQGEEGASVEKVCRKAGISIQTYYRWRKKYRRPDALGDEAPETTRGGKPAPQAPGGRSEPGQGDAPGGGAKKALRPTKRRELIDDLRLVWQVSVRRACAVLGAVRSTYQYQSRRPPQAVLKKRIVEIAQTRVRYGYRRIHVLLKREGWQVNVKRVYRLYAEESLQLRNKTPKRKVSAKLREDRCVASAPNEVWAMDFMSDQLFDGRRICILTIINAFSRLSPAT